MSAWAWIGVGTAAFLIGWAIEDIFKIYIGETKEHRKARRLRKMYQKEIHVWIEVALNVPELEDYAYERELQIAIMNYRKWC